MEVFAEFRFEAAHRLPHVAPEHKCARMHGHSYRARVVVAGPLDAARGWVIDFDDIHRAARPLVDQLDHRVLNEVQGLENPTAEHIARWLWRGLKPALPGLAAVRVEEGQGMGCVYRGETVP